MNVYRKGLGAIESELSSITADEKRIVDGQGYLAQVKRQLDEHLYNENEFNIITELNMRIASLDYDATHHADKEKEMSVLLPFDDKKHRLEEAEKLLTREEEALAQYRERLAGLEKKEVELGGERGKLETELSSLPQIVSDLKRAESELSGSESWSRFCARGLAI